MTAPWLSIPDAEVADICSVQCGAKCCNRPFMYLADSELHLFPDQDIRQSLDLGDQIFNAETGGFLVLDSVCPHLQPDNLCGIHDERPKACRQFPYGPTPGCFLWPIDSASLKI